MARPVLMGFLGLADSRCVEAFAPFHAAGLQYRDARLAELLALHGGEQSAAVGAMVTTASQQLACSRFAYAMAAATGERDWAMQASKLGNDARASEAAAFELAAREARLAAPRARTPLDELEDEYQGVGK